MLLKNGFGKVQSFFHKIMSGNGNGNGDLDLLKQEIEILRNEMQDNIAAIHRLEILTLSSRMDLLGAFGKALPPTVPGRTRRSHKPQGFSFGIITNGMRPEKLAKLIDSIKFQKLYPDYYEIMVAGCASNLNGSDGIRAFPWRTPHIKGDLAQ